MYIVHSFPPSLKRLTALKFNHMEKAREFWLYLLLSNLPAFLQQSVHYLQDTQNAWFPNWAAHSVFTIARDWEFPFSEKIV